MELLRRRENLAGGLGVLKRYFLTAQVGRAGGRGRAEGLCIGVNQMQDGEMQAR